MIRVLDVELAQVQKALRRASRAGQDLRPVWRSMRRPLRRRQGEHIKEQQGPRKKRRWLLGYETRIAPWPRLAPATVVATKKSLSRAGKLHTKRGKVRKPALRRIGRMLSRRLVSGSRIRSRREELRITSPVRWSGVQQAGGRVGRGAILPARPFMYIDAPIARLAAIKIRKHLAGAFEGKQVASKRQTVEDAVIALVGGSLLRAAGGYLAAVEPYNGEIEDSETLEDLVRLLRGRSPSVLVAAASADIESRSMARRNFGRELEVEFVVVSNHLRSREDRNRSDVVAAADPTADPGCYQIVEDLFDLLAGQSVAIGASPLLPQREEVAVRSDRLTVWRLRYETIVDSIVLPHDHGETPLESVGVKGSISDLAADESPNPITESEIDLT